MKPQWYVAWRGTLGRNGQPAIQYRIGIEPQLHNAGWVTSGPLTHPEAHRLVRQWQGLDGPPRV